jgi:hypothetical protein
VNERVETGLTLAEREELVLGTHEKRPALAYERSSPAHPEDETFVLQLAQCQPYRVAADAVRFHEVGLGRYLVTWREITRVDGPAYFGGHLLVER